MAARGHLLVRAGRFTPTTQACSTPGCTHRNRDLKGLDGLAIRAWTCPACSADHDRDVNAARNILVDGLRRFQDSLETPDSPSCPGTSVPGADGTPGVPSSTVATPAADSSGVVRRRLRAERAQDLAHLHPELRAICARGGLRDVLRDTEARTQSTVRGPTASRCSGARAGASVDRMRRLVLQFPGAWRSGLERQPGYALRCPGARPAVRLVHRSRAAPDGDARGLGPSRPEAGVERRRKSPRPLRPRWTTGPHGSRRHRGRKSPDRTTGRRKPTRMNPANRVRRANPGTGAGRRPGCCAPR